MLCTDLDDSGRSTGIVKETVYNLIIDVDIRFRSLSVPAGNASRVITEQVGALEPAHGTLHRSAQIRRCLGISRL